MKGSNLFPRLTVAILAIAGTVAAKQAIFRQLFTVITTPHSASNVHKLEGRSVSAI